MQPGKREEPYGQPYAVLCPMVQKGAWEWLLPLHTAHARNEASGGRPGTGTCLQASGAFFHRAHVENLFPCPRKQEHADKASHRPGILNLRLT